MIFSISLRVFGPEGKVTYRIFEHSFNDLAALGNAGCATHVDLGERFVAAPARFKDREAGINNLGSVRRIESRVFDFKRQVTVFQLEGFWPSDKMAQQALPYTATDRIVGILTRLDFKEVPFADD